MNNRYMPDTSATYAREALPLSNGVRGLSAMDPSGVGKMNSQDGGAMSKPNMNQQPQMAQQFAVQGMSVNNMTNLPQSVVAAMGRERAKMAAMNDQEYSAQRLLTSKVDDILDATGQDTALMEIASKQSPEKMKMMTDVAEAKAMYSGMAPELGAYAAETQQYRMV